MANPNKGARGSWSNTRTAEDRAQSREQRKDKRLCAIMDQVSNGTLTAAQGAEMVRQLNEERSNG